MTDETLLPCPFCGSSDIDPEGVASFKKEYRSKDMTWDNDATPEHIEHRSACQSCNATTDGNWNARFTHRDQQAGVGEEVLDTALTKAICSVTCSVVEMDDKITLLRDSIKQALRPYLAPKQEEETKKLKALLAEIGKIANGIRAGYGAPLGYQHEYFSTLVDAIHTACDGDCLSYSWKNPVTLPAPPKLEPSKDSQVKGVVDSIAIAGQAFIQKNGAMTDEQAKAFLNLLAEAKGDTNG